MSYKITGNLKVANRVHEVGVGAAAPVALVGGHLRHFSLSSRWRSLPKALPKGDGLSASF